MSAFEKALAVGRAPASKPHEVPLGQEISYVRDLNGCLVESAELMTLES